LNGGRVRDRFEDQLLTLLWVEENAYTPERRRDLLNNLQPFGAHCGVKIHEASDIAAGPR